MIADVVEALIGACLESAQMIIFPVIFLHELGFTALENLEIRNEIFRTSIQIKEKDIRDIISLNYPRN